MEPKRRSLQRGFPTRTICWIHINLCRCVNPQLMWGDQTLQCHPMFQACPQQYVWRSEWAHSFPFVVLQTRDPGVRAHFKWEDFCQLIHAAMKLVPLFIPYISRFPLGRMQSASRRYEISNYLLQISFWGAAFRVSCQFVIGGPLLQMLG